MHMQNPRECKLATLEITSLTLRAPRKCKSHKEGRLSTPEPGVTVLSDAGNFIQFEIACLHLLHDCGQPRLPAVAGGSRYGLHTKNEF